MTDNQTPPDWVLNKANVLSGWDEDPELGAISYANDITYRALCDMIERHEKPPVDRKLLCAREAWAEDAVKTTPRDQQAAKFRSGEYDRTYHVSAAVRAIELWEEGFGG